MVSFNRNIANDPFFQVSRSGKYLGRVDSICASQSGHDWLEEVTLAWHQLLSTIGELQLTSVAHIPSSRNVICAQPDFSTMVISILNRFQLLMWMYESQSENLVGSDKNGSFEDRLVRILDSIQRDLIRLRNQVNESSFQSRLTHRTELTDHLERFFVVCNRRIGPSVQ